jgi:serine/threonine protein kinase
MATSVTPLSTDEGLQPSKVDRLNGEFIDQLATFFPHTAYSDRDIQEIADLLCHANSSWSQVPRVYIVMRAIGQLQLLDELISFGFSDHWLPVSRHQLPACLNSGASAKFLQKQSVICQNEADKENVFGPHRRFHRDVLAFETIRILGSGGSGQVEEVLHQPSNKKYVRKLILRRGPFSKNKNIMGSYISELEVLKRLKHRHIVDLVGSYTTPTYLGLIMSPVADCNLYYYLVQEALSPQKLGLVRKFFGCLATAVAYLHDARVRHKDIKPQNILVKDDTILLTDFGLSFDSTKSEGSTTEGLPAGLSQRYCAPEVIYYEPRNSSSDIWSLGCVFLEMVTILKGQTIQKMNTYFETHGSFDEYFYGNPGATEEWMAELSKLEPICDNQPLSWIKGMLELGRHDRVTATSLVATIRSDAVKDSSTSSFSRCCLQI